MPGKQSAQQDVPTVAWAFWAGWRGPPELVVHVVRRALSAVGSTDEDRPPAVCKMDVHVKEDVESIQRFNAFETEVTDDALQNFSVIAIDVRGPRGRVNVYLARKTHAELGPPRSGALVTVSESTEAVDVREVVARAVERRTGQQKRYCGETATVIDVREAVAAAAPHEPRGAFVLKAVPAGVVGVVSSQIAGGSDDTLTASELFPLAAAAVAVGLVWVIAVLLIPRVEVQAVTRARRAADLAYKGVGAALVTAIIGVAVKLVFGGDVT